MIEGMDRHIVPVPEAGCWLWSGAWNATGYGKVADGRRSNVLAHRRAYEACIGPIPKGLHVLHRCDTPCCVNPAHLRLGTHEDNMADMRAKGRAVGHAGASNPRAKLTEDQVREIRASSLPPAELSRHYGVTLTMIRYIRTGKSWTHVQ